MAHLKISNTWVNPPFFSNNGAYPQILGPVIIVGMRKCALTVYSFLAVTSCGIHVCSKISNNFIEEGHMLHQLTWFSYVHITDTTIYLNTTPELLQSRMKISMCYSHQMTVQVILVFAIKKKYDLGNTPVRNFFVSDMWNRNTASVLISVP